MILQVFDVVVEFDRFEFDQLIHLNHQSRLSPKQIQYFPNQQGDKIKHQFTTEKSCAHFLCVSIEIQ